MIVLGIDPGYAIVGWGIVNFTGISYQPLGFGAVITESDTNFNQRLAVIYEDVSRIIRKSRPEAMAIEKLYFQNNQKTAINVAQARGVILLSAQQQNIPIFEYTPLQIKTVVTGYGKAKKPQVMEMTRRLLHLKEVPKPDDTADALAVALCHIQANGSGIRRILSQGRF